VSALPGGAARMALRFDPRTCAAQRGARPARRVARAVATPASKSSKGSNDSSAVTVTVDNKKDKSATLVKILASNKPGLLNTVCCTLKDLGMDVARAEVETTNDQASDVFYVQDEAGKKLTKEAADNVAAVLTSVLSQSYCGGSTPGAVRHRKTGGDSRPAATVPEAATRTEDQKHRSQLLYSLMDTYLKSDVLSLQQSIINHVEYTVANSRYRFSNREAYQATAMSVRDRLIESWNDTQAHFNTANPKRVYYLSMEFLMGRSLLNSVSNLGLHDQYREALAQLGYDLETLIEEEKDAALGNGGLGRLAACFLDSMASLNLPAWGYGIRYQYGMFKQMISDGFQHESPDYWLTFGNPWEIERVNVRYPVSFYGHVQVYDDEGRQRFKWAPAEIIEAVAYDNPIPGFGTENTTNLRLWGAKPAEDFDLESFNTGDYVAAILNKQRAETISAVLYPDDRTYQGKELRLKQQHFFVSASIQDMMRRYKEYHETFDEFPTKVAIQLNDTHPTIGVAELMRVLMDDEGMGWTAAWAMTTRVFSFTNHTVLPEALEKWPVELVEQLLPRHMQIIYDINWRFLQEVRTHFGDDWDRISRMSIIEESDGYKAVRMASLALVASHTINGVAAIHSELIKETIFKDFYELWPHKFQNKTNGVTQRRWLAFCNPSLSDCITETLGTSSWTTHLDMLAGLREHSDDPKFRERWWASKQASKAKLARLLEERCGITPPADALFDVQVKRIHEYKRQLLNVLGVIDRYQRLKLMTPEERAKMVPRMVILGGKAAPGYDAAKRIIKLVNAVGDVINNDEDTSDMLKIAFMADYNVSLAEVIVPGSELSQHISTAGTEASGTSNMKLAMNGGLIIGTMDGANVEIAEEIGEENMFIFGARKEEVTDVREGRALRQESERFYEVVSMIRGGAFGWEEYFAPLLDNLEAGGDFYLLQHDFDDYLRAQADVDEAYLNREQWITMSIMSTAGSGKFSSDRTVNEYAEDIWGIEPCPRPL
jgi:starch phosphorylase